jgi:hypothetical protein
MLRKANGTIDISSALTALKAALFFDGVVMFASSIRNRVKIPGGLSGIVGGVSDLAHTSRCVRCRAAAMPTSSGHCERKIAVRSRCAVPACRLATGGLAALNSCRCFRSTAHGPARQLRATCVPRKINRGLVPMEWAGLNPIGMLSARRDSERAMAREGDVLRDCWTTAHFAGSAIGAHPVAS